MRRPVSSFTCWRTCSVLTMLRRDAVAKGYTGQSGSIPRMLWNSRSTAMSFSTPSGERQFFSST